MLSVPVLRRVPILQESRRFSISRTSTGVPPERYDLGTAARSSQLDASHPSLAFRKVTIKAATFRRAEPNLPESFPQQKQVRGQSEED